MSKGCETLLLLLHLYSSQNMGSYALARLARALDAKIMQCEQLQSPAWWSRLTSKLPAPVRAARPTGGAIRQKNSSVLPYTLTYV